MTLSTKSSNTPRTPRRTGRKPVTLTPAELDALGVLSVAEVSALVRIAEDTVRREVRAGNLKAEDYGTPGRPVYRITREALNAWRAARAVTPTGQDGK
ncbi:helix-turn-helix domain-containing protein [Deinococcus arenicola]|uniref:Helix-turn-helix domain-containing protein n=1 Tax=Deinococcus arenicola TaxID=2994950 RepID=A0ABU4DUG9_9DEIO|nr:helix-turn-helix domain-containing protein [Deinococcus sp. ZS9-10]MDV6376090.1 helix-turn-helix domain-containing protein [Deinococcus sp. ZS9-10]